MIIAGTGHRPKYCPCGYKDDHPWLNNLKKRIENELEVKEVKRVISGVALGFDMWLAEAALKLGIPLHCYVPYSEQGKKWPEQSRKRLANILYAAEIVVHVSTSYTQDCFLKRDRLMVEDSDEILALWNPEVISGGTFYTVKYAQSKGKVVTNLWQE